MAVSLVNITLSSESKEPPARTIFNILAAFVAVFGFGMGIASPHPFFGISLMAFASLYLSWELFNSPIAVRLISRPFRIFVFIVLMSAFAWMAVPNLHNPSDSNNVDIAETSTANSAPSTLTVPLSDLPPVKSRLPIPATESPTPISKGDSSSQKAPTSVAHPAAETPKSGPEELAPSHPAAKQKALDLSIDILRFVTDRKKTQPSVSALTIRNGVLEQQLSQFDQDYRQWMSETGDQYRILFAGRITAVLQDAKAAKVAVGDADLNCATSAGAGADGNLAVIEMCGANIGAIAERFLE